MTRASGRMGEGRQMCELQPLVPGTGLMTAEQTTGGLRKSKPMMKADTPSQTLQGKNIQNCSFTNTRKEIKHETTEKSSRILNIN